MNNSWKIFTEYTHLDNSEITWLKETQGVNNSLHVVSINRFSDSEPIGFLHTLVSNQS